MDNGLDRWYIMGHIHECLRQRFAQPTREDRIKQCFYVLAERLSDSQRQHADALEHWSFIDGTSIASGK